MIVRGIRARPKGKTAPHAAQGLNEQKCVGGWAFRTNLDEKTTLFFTWFHTVLIFHTVLYSIPIVFRYRTW